MLKRFKKFIEKKGLVLSAEKSKIIVFENGKGRKKKREWKWEEEDIEEIKEIKYLGYILQKKGNTHIYRESNNGQVQESDRFGTISK